MAEEDIHVPVKETQYTWTLKDHWTQEELTNLI